MNLTIGAYIAGAIAGIFFVLYGGYISSHPKRANKFLIFGIIFTIIAVITFWINESNQSKLVEHSKHDTVKVDLEQYDVRAYDKGTAIGKVENLNINTRQFWQIPSNKISWLIENLSTLKGSHISIAGDVNDGNACQFARQLSSCFDSAGWILDRTTDTQFRSQSTGIKIISTIEPNRAAEHLVLLFQELGIMTRIYVNPKFDVPLEIQVRPKE